MARAVPGKCADTLREIHDDSEKTIREFIDAVELEGSTAHRLLHYENKRKKRQYMCARVLNGWEGGYKD